MEVSVFLDTNTFTLYRKSMSAKAAKFFANYNGGVLMYLATYTVAQCPPSMTS